LKIIILDNIYSEYGYEKEDVISSLNNMIINENEDYNNLTEAIDIISNNSFLNL